MQGSLSSGNGTGPGSGRIAADGNIGKVTIGNDLIGESGAKSSSIFAVGDIDCVKIGDGLIGGGAVNTGSIFTQQGSIGSVTIGGEIQSSTGVRNASIRAARSLGPSTWRLSNGNVITPEYWPTSACHRFSYP